MVVPVVANGFRAFGTIWAADLTSVEAAYWTDVGTKEHLRWVMPEPEDALLDYLHMFYKLSRTGVAARSPRSSGAR